MRSRNVWQALVRPRYLVSVWPWRATAYLASGAVVGAGVLVGLVVAAAVCGALVLVVVGVPLGAGLCFAGVPVGALERRRLRIVEGEKAAAPHREVGRGGVRAWARLRVREQATWRELAYALLFAVVLWPLDLCAVALALAVPLDLVAAPALLAAGGDREVRLLKLWTVTSWPAACGAAAGGLLLLGGCLYALGAVAGARAALTRALLASRDAEGERITELTRSRVRLVDAFEAERRRIERDLHDGAQQRLVALTMTLGLARLDAPPGPVADLIATAHRETEEVLKELRELIHGIHPQVLADYGLAAAVADAADRSPVPVGVQLDLHHRLPGPVEAAAYFVVREALVNVARHSGATGARITGGHRQGWLTVEVRDDGRGGADADQGTGLVGLADRVSVLDGRLTLSSPPGGPTLLRVEIPCPTIPRPPSRPATASPTIPRPTTPSRPPIPRRPADRSPSG